MKKLYKVKASHKGPHTVWFHLHRTSRTGKFMEIESKLVIVEGEEWAAEWE